MIAEKDEKLLALLRLNAREPVTSLARKLGISRSTVQDRLKRLESSGVIQGYAVRLSSDAKQAGMRAFVPIEIDPRRAPDVTSALKRFPEVETLHAVSGKYDLVALIQAKGADALDVVLDRIGALPGVKRTESAIILSTRFDRR